MSVLSRQEIQLAWEDAASRLAAPGPTNIVHAAPATAGLWCEWKPDWAFAVNPEGTHRVAEACRAAGARLLHVSTDCVFDGTKESAHPGEDPPAPLNAWCLSKLAAEIPVRHLAPGWATARKVCLFGRGRRKFVGKILGRLRGGQPLMVVTDQMGSPTCAADLPAGIGCLVEGEAAGTFHRPPAGPAPGSSSPGRPAHTRPRARPSRQLTWTCGPASPPIRFRPKPRRPPSAGRRSGPGVRPSTTCKHAYPH